MPPLTRSVLVKVTILLLVILTAVVTVELYLNGGPETYDAEGLKTWLQQLPAWIFCAVFFVAPLLTVPLSVMLVSAGLLFPLHWAVLLTTFTLAVHHLLVFFFKDSAMVIKFQNVLHKRNLLPNQVDQRKFLDDFLFITAATWLPGFSYILKIIVVAMVGMNLWRFLLLGTFAQLLHALPFLYMGELLDQGQLLWIGLAFVVLFVGTWVVRKMLMRKPVFPVEPIEKQP